MRFCAAHAVPRERRGGSTFGARRPLLRGSFACLVGLAVLGGCGAQNYAQAPRVCETPVQADVLAEQLYRLINLERALADVEPLDWDEDLAKVAQDYACRMIEGDFFGHVDPVTKSAPDHRLTLAGYEFDVMGENLALGQTTAAEVLDSWMASPSHRDNILSPSWTQLGIGIRTDPDGTVHWVLEFADPA